MQTVTSYPWSLRKMFVFSFASSFRQSVQFIFWWIEKRYKRETSFYTYYLLLLIYRFGYHWWFLRGVCGWWRGIMYLEQLLLFFRIWIRDKPAILKLLGFILLFIMKKQILIESSERYEMERGNVWKNSNEWLSYCETHTYIQGTKRKWRSGYKLF